MMPVRTLTTSLIATTLLGVGCNRRATQADPPSYQAESPSEQFGDGASARPLITGVVPRPADESPGIPYVSVASPGPVNMEAAPTTPAIPFVLTDALIARGQERFNIYCVACHGRAGDGDGAVVARGFTRPPSFYSQALLNAPDVHFFDVITNGKGAMFSYDDRIAPDDRWAIVAYIRTLQEAARQTAPTLRPPSYAKGAP